MNEAAPMMPSKALAIGYRSTVKNLPLDSRLAHPFDRGIGLVYQKPRPLWDRLASRHPHHVGVKIVFGVRRKIDFLPLLFRNVRQERFYVGNPVMNMTKLCPVAIRCVSAPLRRRGLFQHKNSRSRTVSGKCCRLRRITKADDYYVVIFYLHLEDPCFSVTGPYHLCLSNVH